MLNRDNLGLQRGESLLGGFLPLLRNQNFTGRPNVMQSKNSTINPRKRKVKIRLVASVRSETIATITISNFSATAPIKPIPKRVLLNILGLIKRLFHQPMQHPVALIVAHESISIYYLIRQVLGFKIGFYSFIKSILSSHFSDNSTD